jgi:hypothetical protein
VSRTPRDSHFWAGLLNVKEDFLRRIGSKWVMAKKLGSGKIFGLMVHHSMSNFLTYTKQCAKRMS